MGFIISLISVSRLHAVNYLSREYFYPVNFIPRLILSRDILKLIFFIPLILICIPWIILARENFKHFIVEQTSWVINYRSYPYPDTLSYTTGSQQGYQIQMGKWEIGLINYKLTTSKLINGHILTKNVLHLLLENRDKELLSVSEPF